MPCKTNQAQWEQNTGCISAPQRWRLLMEKPMSVKYLAASLALLFAAGGAPALGQVKIGVITSATGPTAMVGIPQKNTVPLLPTQIGDLTVDYISLDDAS